MKVSSPVTVQSVPVGPLGLKTGTRSARLVDSTVCPCQEVCTHFAHTFLLQRTFNPFTAPTCKISGMNDEGTRLQSLFSVLKYVFSDLRFDASAKKKTNRLKGFKFRTFRDRFQMTSWQ